MSKPTAIVYVDGFNLYRRALENTPYRWLDIDVLVSMLLADYEVIQIRYFTANIKSLPNDLAQAQRQQTYLRALESDPKIVIHKGQFRSDIKLMPVVPWEFDENGNPVTVKVRKRKEKGSDVNLATYLLLDAFMNRAEAYFVLSNDSDFVEPIKVIKEKLRCNVGLILPTENSSKKLKLIAEPSIHYLRKTALLSAQFPDVVFDSKGAIMKPLAW